MKKLSIFLAFVATLALAGTTFAANVAYVGVEQKPITYQATCEQLGKIDLAFDPGTEFVAGQRLYIHLKDQATLCTAIDLMVGEPDALDASGIASSNNTYILTGTGAPITGSGTLEVTPGNPGVKFRITGAIASNLITIAVLQGDDTAVTGSMIYMESSDSSDRCTLSMFGQVAYAGNDAKGTIGMWTDYDADTLYPLTEDTLAINNTFCVNVENSPAGDITAALDSLNSTHSFKESQQVIAFTETTSTVYEFEPCKEPNCGLIDISDTSVQGGSPSCVVDNEYNDFAGLGFCTGDTENLHQNNAMVIQRADADYFETGNYKLTLEILVNDASGANGIYWSSTDGAYTPLATYDYMTFCNQLNAGTPLGGTYYLSDGTTVVAAPAAASGCPTIATTQRSTIYEVASFAPIAAPDTTDYLFIDLPTMVYDSDLVDGDAVSVRVTLTKLPCDTLFTGTMCIGTAEDNCPSNVASTRIYPYYPNESAGSWWSGVVVTNLSDFATEATITRYEKDGDVFQATTGAIAARSHYVGLLQGLTWTAPTGVTNPDGVVNNSTCYLIVATGNGASITGFAMMANEANDQSMGYLPHIPGM